MRCVGQGPPRPAGREIGIDCAAAAVDDANLSDGGGVHDAAQPAVDLLARPPGRLRGENKVIQHRRLRGHVLAQDAFDHGRNIGPLRGISVHGRADSSPEMDPATRGTRAGGSDLTAAHCTLHYMFHDFQ